MEAQGIYGAKLVYDPADLKEGKGAVIVCPGGGYEFLSPREADPVAEAFRKKGYMPYILYYDIVSPVLKTRPMEQAAWAVREARKLRPDWPVFLCGFSAGGHLAASLGVHWDDGEVFPDREEQKEQNLLIGRRAGQSGYHHGRRGQCRQYSRNPAAPAEQPGQSGQNQR